MASNMKGFTFNSNDLYGDLVKAHIKIHHLEEALERGEKIFSEFRELFIKIEQCNDMKLIKDMIAEFRATHTAPQ